MKKIIILILAFICLSLNTNMLVYANECQEKSQIYSVDSVGLISKKSIGISANSNTIMLTAKTECTNIMKYVGLKDIKIEQSSDGINWAKYTDVDELINENTSVYVANNLALVSVPNGYYYRVTCNHYAKEKGLLGGSEKDANTSNSIYI